MSGRSRDRYAVGWEEGYRAALVDVRNHKGTKKQLVEQMLAALEQAKRARLAAPDRQIAEAAR